MLEGQALLGVAEMIKDYPVLMEPFLTADNQPLTGGMYYHLLSFVTDFRVVCIYIDNINVYIFCCYFTTDQLVCLFNVIHFSHEGSTEREKEQATYMNFLDLVHQFEGKWGWSLDPSRLHELHNNY